MSGAKRKPVTEQEGAGLLRDAVALLMNQSPAFREELALRLLETEADRAFVFPPPLPGWVTPERHDGYACGSMRDGERVFPAYSILNPGEACGCGCTPGCTPEPGSRESQLVALGCGIPAPAPSVTA